MNKIFNKSKFKYYLVGIFLLSILSLNRLLAVDSIDLSSTDINENIATWTTVATITSSGASWAVVYSFCGTWTDNDSFGLSDDILSSSGAFDFESQASYDICITATDNSWSLDTSFTINVTDLNEDPTDIGLSWSTIDENLASWSTIWTLSTTDQDTGDTFTYTFVAWTWSDDNSSFTISGSTLLSNEVFDFETKSSYTVRVRSTDSWGLFTEKELTITINDLNDGPTALTLSWSSIDENLVIGTTIGTFSWTDDWENNGTLIYSFTTTCASGWVDNGSFSIDGTSLESDEIFDFEAQSSYNVCIRVSDWDLFFDEEFPITINNISINPSDIVLSWSTIDENLATGTTIGTLTWTNDWTSTGTLSFSLACTTPWADDASFSITGTTLSSNAVFDFDTKSTYNICIRVSDWVTNFDKQFSITINNISEGLIDISLSPSTINENLAIWTTVWTLTWINDSTSTWTMVYSLTCATWWTDDASFSITWTTLMSNAVFNFETKSSYNICVRVSDWVTLFDENLVIWINDVNEWGGGWWGGGGGGWWGWWSLVKDSCPGWDFSPSYYDRSCGTSRSTSTWTTTTWTTTTPNPVTVTKDIDWTQVDYTLKDNFSSCQNINSLNNPNFVYNSGYYTDTALSKFRNLIDKFTELKIVNWTAPNLFEPKRNVTRAEFTKMILWSHCYAYRAENTANLVFTDVDKSSWQARVISRAMALWIINWDRDRNWNPVFRPNDYVSNAEALKIILRISNIQIENLDEISYTDVDRSSWHAKYVQMWETLWVLDPSDTGFMFRWNSYINRENVISLIYNVIFLYK